MDKSDIAVLPTKLEKAIGCLSGQLIGSGLGMPWKGLSHLEIMLITRHSGVADFSAPRQTRNESTISNEVGQPAEDYELMRTVAESIINCGRFDLMDCLNVNFQEADGRLSQASGLAGKDNGVARKIPPLALYFNDSADSLHESIKNLGAATHSDPQAYLSAYCIAWVIREVYNNPIGLYTKDQLRRQICELAQKLVLEADIRERPLFSRKESVLLSNMRLLVKMIDSGDIADPQEVAETLGTGRSCSESVPFSIAMFLRHPTCYSAAVIETINQGGDTDSNAALVGAMVGANLGIMAIPRQWRTFRREYEEAGELAVELYKLTADAK